VLAIEDLPNARVDVTDRRQAWNDADGHVRRIAQKGPHGLARS